MAGADSLNYYAVRKRANCNLPCFLAVKELFWQVAGPVLAIPGAVFVIQLSKSELLPGLRRRGSGRRGYGGRRGPGWPGACRSFHRRYVANGGVASRIRALTGANVNTWEPSPSGFSPAAHGIAGFAGRGHGSSVVVVEVNQGCPGLGCYPGYRPVDQLSIVTVSVTVATFAGPGSLCRHGYETAGVITVKDLVRVIPGLDRYPGYRVVVVIMIVRTAGVGVVYGNRILYSREQSFAVSAADPKDKRSID